jgi:hypothetical protein
MHCLSKIYYYDTPAPNDNRPPQLLSDECIYLSSDDGTQHYYNEPQHKGSNVSWAGTAAGTTTNLKPGETPS